jgi:bidirectional [NiFe] hydrogenase diaphorase subunit
MSTEELLQLRAKAEQRTRPDRICVCTAASCQSAGGDQVHQAVAAEVARAGADGRIEVRSVGCMGLCSAGPLVKVENDESSVLYRGVTPEDAAPIVGSVRAEPVERLRCSTSIPFFQKQLKIVLENCGVVHPERIEDYALRGGYQALLRALGEMTPAEVLSEVTASGLRGRGGAGYPVGLKWQTVAKRADPEKYVVCNADEGDPGAFMDRSVLESDPHRVLEGMAIAAYAIGAKVGYVYVRAEYPLAISRLRTAIRQARAANLLGQGVAGTRFDFSLDIRLGAGAFVCGEETALLASIEGRRGQPRSRPPYPAEQGLFKRATLINNVESFSNIPPIIARGGAWFAGIGTERSRGTKVFALAGQIRNTGLIEVPMGISLRTIVEEMGGGVPEGRRIKAVQTGGPSGGCIPAEYLDMPVDYDSLQKVGSIMGSGGMIVMDDSSQMVEVARYFMEFSMSESCGKCVPCRVGTYQMHGILERLLAHQAVKADLDLLEELCRTVGETSLCGLGQSAPNPVKSTLRYFRSEYEEAIRAGASRASAAPRSTQGGEP